MENHKTLEGLLTRISSINKRYEEDAKISGENFNVFNILGLAGKELIHSRMIAMLLDPNGEHGMGDLFLRLFVKTIALEKCADIDYSHATVITEKTIEDGRLDIFVATKSDRIIIENKIYAGDMDEQLLRYHKFDKDAILLHLTLGGGAPGEESAKELKMDEDFHCVSYREDIVKWLQACKEEAANSPPFFRETLNQYILLVKQLTGQARSDEMQKECMDTVLENADSLSAAFFISSNINEIKRRVLVEKFVPLINDLASELGFEPEMDASVENFSFKKSEWKKTSIRFALSRNYQNLWYGFWRSDVSDELHEKLVKLAAPNYQTNNDFPLWNYMEKYGNWDDLFFKDLFSGNVTDIRRVFKDKIEELSSIAENTGLEL
ncbi:MAG: PD-(D/E)XK nuclease family protein [Treponema sp.]|nr:PD-(D/E)XK nuclease family protein [Treponema sp.]